MIAVFIAIFLILLVMIAFIVIVLRIVTDRADKKVNTYFLSKLERMDADFEEKSAALKKLGEEKTELENEISLLKNDRDTYDITKLRRSRPVARDSFIPVAHYIDNNFFEDYKKAKSLLNLDKAEIIRTILEKYPYSGNMARYRAAEGILDKLNFEAAYDMCTLPLSSQREIMDEAFTEEEKALLKEYTEDLPDPDDFDVLKFLNSVKHTRNLESPYIYVATGVPNEDFSSVSEYVVGQYDRHICEGIRITYQNTLYDYSFYESRKRK